jgi:3-oxoacyl-[acyl-carrier-protein] synthase II
VSAGHLTGLSALRYATRMIRRGYADTLIVGAVEELSPPVAWAAHRLRAGRGLERPGGAIAPTDERAPMGEGCVTFLVRSANAVAASGTRPVAAVVDFAFAVTSPDEGPEVQTDALSTVVRTLLTRNGLDPDELWRVSTAQSGDGELDRVEHAALDGAFAGSKGPERIAVSRQIGNSFSALGAFQLAALLATAEDLDDDGADRYGLITALGTDGAVAAALVRT